MLKLRFLVPFIFNISIVISVSIDYYIQKNVDDEHKIANNTLNETRRQDQSYEDEWLMVRSITKRVDAPETTEEKNVIAALQRTVKRKTTTIKFDIKDIFDDKDQDSDDTDIPDTGKIMILHDDPIQNNTQFREATKPLMHDFFNLEAITPELNSSNEYYDNENIKRIWFVPEKYPCWELPMLYGEVNREDTGQIFFTHARQLRNVILKLDQPPQKTMPPRRKLVFDNKWCHVEPCFADHTLCLFNSEKIATMCDKGYVVKTPSIKQQMGLIHTINSMRNHVAYRQTKMYAHLPTAANMQQMNYDLDLQKISATWLRQCLPGPAPCSALNNAYVTQLECTKYGKLCCLDKAKQTLQNCSPVKGCSVPPLFGCLHTWYESAGKALTAKDIQCGNIERSTFHTVQILWAETIHIGCALGERKNGDVRVVCNFSPGAPFIVNTRFYCGVMPSKFIKGIDLSKYDLTRLESLRKLGVKLVQRNIQFNESQISSTDPNDAWGEDSLVNIYKPGWGRASAKIKNNGTEGFVARLVTRYEFIEQDDSICSSGMSVYVPGPSGSTCVQRGFRYRGLCYKFRGPTPGYRLFAVIAPAALFSLILYDLFSGVLRQSNY